MKLYTTQEIAELLQMNIETIRKFIKAKELPAFKVGSEWRIKEEDLKNFIEKKSNIEEK